MNNNENKRLKRKVRNSYIISTISIALVLFLLGAVGFMMAATVRTANTLQESVTLIVELKNDLSPDEGTSNIVSVIIVSQIERRPRAPNLYSTALSTI